MRETRILQRYAKALIEAAETQGRLTAVRADVEGILTLIEASDDLARFLKNPVVEARYKRQTLESLFTGKVQPVVLNFLRLLAEKRRAGLLADILRTLLSMLDEREGIATAEVRTAVPLTPQQEERLRQRLSAYSGKTIRLQVEVQPTLKAGFIARLGDTVFDGSLSRQLELLRQQLAGRSLRSA